MSLRPAVLAASLLLVAPPFAHSSDGLAGFDVWSGICAWRDDSTSWSAADVAARPTVDCTPAPTTYHSLTSVGGRHDTAVKLDIGYDADAKQLCFVSTRLPEAPVLRVGVGHMLSVSLVNTLHDTGATHTRNCPISAFGGEGLCFPTPIFAGIPGADGPYYPLLANQAHAADGTASLHVHGLFVPPTPCSDEVLRSTLYPANWGGPVAPLFSCQAAPQQLSYSYHLPPEHPAGLYWYHMHRHGEAEHQTQMGLIGAIVVEDKGDSYRRSIGVDDEVLVVGDTPRTGCLVGPSCDVVVRPPGGVTRRQPDADAARAQARQRAAASGGQPTLDPRIDQIDQAGECATGATGAAGGTELWTLTLNGAPVPEVQGGLPPDGELLAKTMQPNQRQIFRLVNASANSFLAPILIQSQNGTLTSQPLEVFARDGVGLAGPGGVRHFGMFDVATTPLVVPPAGRVEFVVHAPPVGATLYLQTNEVDPGCGGNAYPTRRLLRITASGTPVDPGAANDSDLLQHTPSLHDYLATLDGKPSVQRTIVLSEYGRGFTYGVTHWLNGPPSASDYDPTQTDFYITQVAASDGSVDPEQTAIKPFTGHTLAPQVVVHLHGKPSVTEDWLVENSTLEIHAFHMHQVHFRDITAPGDDPDTHPLLDTITVPAAPLVGDVATGGPGAPGYVRLRMTFTTADIGEFVFHCHILEHEDNGMMAKIRVVAD